MAGQATRVDASRRRRTREVAAVRRTVPIPAAVEAMVRGRYRAMPVVEADRRLVGVFSEADALGDLLYEQTRCRTVVAVMSTPPISLPATATVDEARRLVAERGLRLVPMSPATRWPES